MKYPVASSTDHHPEVYGEKAWTYLKLSKSFYNKAIDCFHRALEQQPDDCDWNTGYAVVLYRTEEVFCIIAVILYLTELDLTNYLPLLSQLLCCINLCGHLNLDARSPAN